MGGQAGVRGYLIQALIAVLNSLNKKISGLVSVLNLMMNLKKLIFAGNMKIQK